jgi:prepilin-type N-terminal cleavage/methylation domain-containing protein
MADHRKFEDRQAQKGMTLVEILIAALIFSLALGALLKSMGSIIEVIDLARDKSQAVADLRSVLEHMRATPFDLLTARFPNGTQDGTAINNYTAIVGGYKLASEHITVSYVDPNTDPLEIKTMLSWQDKRARTRNASLSTFRTR